MSTGPYSDAIRAIVAPVTSFFDPRPPMIILQGGGADSSGANCPPPLPPVPSPEQFVEISFQDATTKGRISSEDMVTIAEAINTELRDFSSKWRSTLFQLKVYPRGEAVKGGFQYYLKDETDIPGAYGYHTKTSETEAIAYTFVETILQQSTNGILKANTISGTSVARITSHEVLEMIGNPLVNEIVFANFELIPDFRYILFDRDHPDGSEVKKDAFENFTVNNILLVNVLKEVANPVQANTVTLKIRNKDVDVSDYVYPSWFDITNVKGPYNYKKTLIKPFTLDPGGYVDTRLLSGMGRLFISRRLL